VIEGDTVEIDGTRDRLNGIDAPESDQLCRRPDGSRWRCDQKSAFALADFIGRAVVRCESRDRDRYGRIVAVCFRGDIDLNGWLVAAGWAVAFRKCSPDYVSDEDEAQLSKRGIWSGNFDMPWDWRAAKRQPQP
jgi:endonuclease YncB( thermonuclease family)